MTRYFKQPIHCYGHMGMEDIEGNKKIAHMVLQYWYHPLAEDDDYVLTATAMPTAAAGQDIEADSLTNATLDFARNLTMVASAACTSVVTVTGLDWHGDEIEEAFTLNGTDTVTGNKAFASISNVNLAQRDPGAANVKIGIGSKLGAARGLLLFLTEGLVDGVRETTVPVPDATYDTLTFNTALNASKVYLAKYWTDSVT